MLTLHILIVMISYGKMTDVKQKSLTSLAGQSVMGQVLCLYDGTL